VLDRLAVSRAHLLGTDLAAERTGVGEKIALTIGTFIQVGTVQLVRIKSA
jgi:hypothetical protein